MSPLVVGLSLQTRYQQGAEDIGVDVEDGAEDPHDPVDTGKDGGRDTFCGKRRRADHDCHIHQRMLNFPIGFCRSSKGYHVLSGLRSGSARWRALLPNMRRSRSDGRGPWGADVGTKTSRSSTDSSHCRPARPGVPYPSSKRRHACGPRAPDPFQTFCAQRSGA